MPLFSVSILMKELTARFFYCQNCRCQVIICSQCDRGNIYCQPCARIMRKKRLRESCKRYQSTLKGGISHARRQKVYREKLKKVTHHGSKKHSDCDLIFSHKNNKIVNFQDLNPEKIFCCFCGKCCSKFLRQDFLRKKAGKKHRQHSSSWPCAP